MSNLMDFVMHLEGMSLLVVLIGLVLVVLGLIVFVLYCVQSKDTSSISKHVHKDWNPYEVLGVNMNPIAEAPLLEDESIMKNQERKLPHVKHDQIKSASVEQSGG